ncbi:amino acid ABC transporter permease [Bosea sp. 2YAB26]|uniref:amino acid ABC transporter permease n=1 Tax=Bosea sp. 2YAB26 TaxID=3237478 RepID=UPI003F915BCE
MSATTFLRRCISTPLNAAFTAAILIWLGMTLPGLVRWMLVDAVWSGAGPQACAGVDAACWLFIKDRFGQILFGLYPPSERWRPILCLIIAIVGVAMFALPWRRRKALAAFGFTSLYAIVATILLRGGWFGLWPAPTTQWGGIMLTTIVAACTIATSLPVGLALALARRSDLPIVAGLAALYIDVMRGLPLVGVLFLAIVLFPLFAPPGVEINVLLRALIAFSLFNAAIMAEVIRGGLQSVPKGQMEAALSLGLRQRNALVLCVLPQALRAAIPGIVNVSISIIKETTIILIAGLFDFLGVLQGALIDPAWNIGDQIRQTAYFFAGAVFFIICFGLSCYSASIERRLSKGERPRT